MPKQFYLLGDGGNVRFRRHPRNFAAAADNGFVVSCGNTAANSFPDIFFGSLENGGCGEAYLPLLDQIRQRGVTCILVHMPFHMAIFDANAAEKVISQFPEYQNWYIAGHSMGGAMASQFAAEHPDQVDGLILLGAYLYGDYPAENTLTVYGSLNQSVEDHIQYTENIVEIEGDNHAQFGNYGPQKGDPPAAITAQEQQAQAVDAIESFLQEMREKG